MADKKVTSRYRYNAEFSYVNKKTNQVKLLHSLCIKSFVIDHNFIVNNMPILFLNAALDTLLIKDMKDNISTNLINMVLYKYDDCTDEKLNVECFRKDMVYFIPNDVIVGDDELLDVDEEYKDDDFRDITIGLMCLDNINDNKKSFNMTIRNTLKYDIIKYCTSHIKNIVIENFDYNEGYTQFIIPPIDSISKLISYINDNRVLYNTNYRYYLDFNYAYLISSSGKAVPRKDERYTNVAISINELFNDEANDPGIILNKTTGTYEVPVSRTYATVYTDNFSSKIKTEVNSIGYTGTSKKSYNNNDLYGTNKTESVRITNGNDNKINNIINDTNTSGIFITINKNDLDTDIFTINKTYVINNINKYREHDGNYLLLRKREMYIREDDSYVMNMILNFMKL